MGMDQRVTFAPGQAPTWTRLTELLGARGYPVQLRMIDGELAFPDEQPPLTWRELRVGTPQGMITLRRAEAAVTLVTWGNADQGLRQAWNALTWAVAELTGGTVETAAGHVSAAAYAQTAELPACLTNG